MRPVGGQAPSPADQKSWGAVTVLAVLVGAALILTAALIGPPAKADGAAAHNFALPPLLNSAQRISLSDYRGQPVILNFCSAWSPPCQVETEVLQTFYRRHHGSVIIIGVDSRDSRAAALRLLTSSGVQYPVAWDPAQSVGGLYGIPGIPTTYFLNSQHQIIRTNLGWLSIAKLQRAKAVMDAAPAAP
jgi:cytochrome c biogenesis protein CcmG/thiol:disulfide interchange protein DsbE